MKRLTRRGLKPFDLPGHQDHGVADLDVVRLAATGRVNADNDWLVVHHERYTKHSVIFAGQGGGREQDEDTPFSDQLVNEDLINAATLSVTERRWLESVSTQIPAERRVMRLAVLPWASQNEWE